MKTPSSIPLFLVAACAACSATAWDRPADPNSALPISKSTSDAAVTNTDAITVVAPAANADALTGSANEPDARAPSVNLPVSCKPDETYAIDLCSEWVCPDGTIAKSVCNATGNGYYLWEDTQSVCGCPTPAGNSIDAATPDAVPAPQTPPPAGNDAGITLPPTIYYDAGRSNDTSPDESPVIIVPTKPDASHPTDAFAPVSADAKMTPDVATVETPPCGCQTPDTAPTLDTTPYKTDAGVTDVAESKIDAIVNASVPDAEADTYPDTLPDAIPYASPKPDVGCTAVESITISAVPLVCGQMISWNFVGCSTKGFKVVWSMTADPTYPTRANDKYVYVSNPATRSQEIYNSDAFGGLGTYYVRVCAYDGNGACLLPYSNQVTITLPSAAH